jgi:hypothetical protein
VKCWMFLNFFYVYASLKFVSNYSRMLAGTVVVVQVQYGKKTSFSLPAC